MTRAVEGWVYCPWMSRSTNSLLEQLRDIDNSAWSSLGEDGHVMLSSPREAEALHQELSAFDISTFPCSK